MGDGRYVDPIANSPSNKILFPPIPFPFLSATSLFSLCDGDGALWPHRPPQWPPLPPLQPPLSPNSRGLLPSTTANHREESDPTTPNLKSSNVIVASRPHRQASRCHCLSYLRCFAPPPLLPIVTSPRFMALDTITPSSFPLRPISSPTLHFLCRAFLENWA